MTGDPERVKDRPQFEVDDTTTSYTPPRSERPRWVDQGRSAGTPNPSGVPQPSAPHWFDPESGRAAPPPSAPTDVARPSTSRSASGRGPSLGSGLLIATIAAVTASALTVGILAAGGWLGRGEIIALGPSATEPTPGWTRTVTIEDSDRSRAAAAAMPAIVTIVSADSVAPGPVLATALRGAEDVRIGSGIIFHSDGWIITSRRMGCAAGDPLVLLSDGRQLQAQRYGVDPLTDLAILRVQAQGLPVASIGDSGSLRPGQVAMVIGSAWGSLSRTVTSGVISALGRDIHIEDPCAGEADLSLRNLIQTDARVDADDAGGALISATGEVIGITTAVPGTDQGGYAIPISIAKPIMEQALARKQLTRPWMGISYVALNAGIAQANRLSIDHGAWLQPAPDGSSAAVVPGGPAALAGLREGDVLTAIDDQRIDSAHPLDEILAQYQPADQDPLSVSFLRDGVPHEVLLMLGTRPDPTS